MGLEGEYVSEGRVRRGEAVKPCVCTLPSMSLQSAFSELALSLQWEGEVKVKWR